MKVGFSNIALTPKFPAQLVGYAPEREANETLDDICVKVILFEDKERTVLISYDILGFDDLLLEPLYDLCKKFNIEEENVFVTATHTHSSQGGVIDVDEGVIKGSGYILGHRNDEWCREIIDKTRIALADAIRTLSEGTLEYSIGEIKGVGSNRNDQSLPGDESLLVLKISNSEEKVVLYNYACHPTILKGDNKKVSSDFPGVVDSRMQEYGYKFAFFMNGSAGDISTRFTRKSDEVEELNRLSEIIVSALNDNLNKMKQADLQVSTKWVSIDLKTKDPLHQDEAEKTLNDYQKQLESAYENNLSISERRTLESYVEGAKASLEYARNTKEAIPKKINLCTLNISGFSLVGVPGELYSELSNPLKTEKNWFVSYANGYYGYFVNENAFINNYYEAQSSPYVQGESEKMMNVIENSLNR